jgi:general secretion pathway protein D
MELLAKYSGINVVVSEEAAKRKVTFNLRNVSAMTAVDTLCRANGLFFRRDPKTGVIVITTADEYQKNLVVFREDRTQVYTLLYPNALDLAVAIRDLYGTRVQLSLGRDQYVTDADEVQRRFDVFDLLDQRTQLGLFGGGGGVGGGVGGFGGGGFGGGVGGFGGRGGGVGGGLRGGQFGGGGFGNTGFGNLGGGFNNIGGFNNPNVPGGLGSQRQPLAPPEQLSGLTPEQLEALRAREVGREGVTGVEAQRLADLRRNQATIFVTLVRRNNQVIVRTSDPLVLEEIGRLKERLDVPTPQVLLEVKVLSVDLTDGFRSIFDLQFSDGRNSAGFATGTVPQSGTDAPFGIVPPAAALVPGDRRSLGLNVGGSGGPIPAFGLDPTSLIYQFVDNNFRLRMQLLEDRNRVTVLATPMLLVANNEVSRVFIGEERPITTNISGGTVVSNLGGNATTTGSATTTLRQVGTTLLLTPNINADRTVTLRLLQETSTVIPGGASIPVVNINGLVTNQPVDVVASRTLTGTVIAKDGMTLALGGLIEETLQDQRQEVPIVGKIPVLGFFFRRQATGRSRRELVVVVRPYVLSTPNEGQAISKRLTDAVAIHPKASEVYPPPGEPLGDAKTFLPREALRPNPPRNRLETIFRFYSVLPADF